MKGEYFDASSPTDDAPCKKAWQTDVWHEEEQVVLENDLEGYLAAITLSSVK